MKCSKKRCRNESSLIYLGNPLCDKHWEEHCDKEDKKNGKNYRETKTSK